MDYGEGGSKVVHPLLGKEINTRARMQAIRNRIKSTFKILRSNLSRIKINTSEYPKLDKLLVFGIRRGSWKILRERIMRLQY